MTDRSHAEALVAEIKAKLADGCILMLNRKQIEGAENAKHFSVDATGHPCYRGNSIKYASVRYFRRVAP